MSQRGKISISRLGSMPSFNESGAVAFGSKVKRDKSFVKARSQFYDDNMVDMNN